LSSLLSFLRRESPAERLAFPPESSNLMYGMYYRTKDQAKTDVFDYIERLYNRNAACASSGLDGESDDEIAFLTAAEQCVPGDNQGERAASIKVRTCRGWRAEGRA
jgi:hypothetical protein